MCCKLVKVSTTELGSIIDAVGRAESILEAFVIPSISFAFIDTKSNQFSEVIVARDSVCVVFDQILQALPRESTVWQHVYDFTCRTGSLDGLLAERVDEAVAIEVGTSSDARVGEDHVAEVVITNIAQVQLPENPIFVQKVRPPVSILNADGRTCAIRGAGYYWEIPRLKPQESVTIQIDYDHDWTEIEVLENHVYAGPRYW